MIFHVIFIVDIIFEPIITSDAHKDFSTNNNKDDVVNEDNEKESWCHGAEQQCDEIFERKDEKKRRSKYKKFVLKNQCTKSHLCDIKLACFDILWYLFPPKVL